MNLMNRVKTAVGIDPAYDIPSSTLGEVDRAKAVFIAAAAEFMKYRDVEKEDIVSYGLCEVWHTAKQYYAQHPEELHKCVVL